MFANKSSLLGGLSTAIPGEIAGFAAAHRLGGRLPWRDLFEPAIRMCIEGYPVSLALDRALTRFEEYIRADPVLAETFINRQTGHVLKLGEKVQRPRLGMTLMKLAEKGPNVFYDGTLTGMMVDEINSHGIILAFNKEHILRKYIVMVYKGGNVSLKDFVTYKAESTDALVLDLDDTLKVATASLPSSGILTTFIMKIMKS